MNSVMEIRDEYKTESRGMCLVSLTFNITALRVLKYLLPPWGNFHSRFLHNVDPVC